jgi:hypothetical protein
MNLAVIVGDMPSDSARFGSCLLAKSCDRSIYNFRIIYEIILAVCHAKTCAVIDGDLKRITVE